MIVRKTLISFVLFFIFVVGTAPNSFAQKRKRGSFSTIKKDYPDSRVDGYNLYVPPTYDAADPMPVLIFLQGGLGVGGKVDVIYNWGLPKILKQTQKLENEKDSLLLTSFICIMPHITQGQFYTNVSAIKAIIKEVGENYQIDEKRIYLTGLSRGGHGTWGLASKMPETFAAVAPIAGGLHGVEEEDYEKLAQLPIWASHNPEDNIVGFEGAENAVERIERITGKAFQRTGTIAEADFQGQDFIFTLGKNEVKPHDTWTEMYNEANFYKWLLRHRKE